MATISLRQVYRCPVVNQHDADVGIVDDVLFHPTEPYAVGFSVKPHRIGGIIPLPMRYLTFAMAEFDTEGRLKVKVDALEGVAESTITREAKSAWGAKAERRSGVLWDETVVYYGQEVVTEDGKTLGKISDARFNPETGGIIALQITSGATSDLTLGKRTLAGELVHGFEPARHAVIVANEATQAQYGGGAAQTTGKATASAEKFAEEMGEKAAVAAEKVGEAAIQGAAKAAVYTERALKAAAKSETGRKAKKMFSSFATNFKEALNDERDEEA